ncbi:hypothetical protein PHLH5_28410 [Pseudomonas sp. Cab53]|nr:hypothetical protein PHLH5_28410 [Pseudomonas sp. Cab53]
MSTEYRYSAYADRGTHNTQYGTITADSPEAAVQAVKDKYSSSHVVTVSLSVKKTSEDPTQPTQYIEIVTKA